MLRIDNWPWLPIEIYIHILGFLPPTEGSADIGVKTLVSCLSTNGQLRAAALTSSLWESHYLARYTTCDEERERQRREETNGDWRLMYLARRALDSSALRLLDDIRVQLSGRYQKARVFTQELSFDVWDALERESQLPLPAYFRERNEVDGEEGETDEKDVPHALPRRYWAKTMMGVIARHHTLRMWARLYSGGPEGDSITFEEALAGLSTFFDESPKRIYSWLGELAARCRRTLLDACVELDPHSPKYDLPDLCIRIRQIFRSLGFANAEGPDFYDMLNQFPHALMEKNPRRTIPMSLVYVFVAICRRLGIQAAPTNFPGKVLCHITPADQNAHEMLFDVCENTLPLVFTSQDTSRVLTEVGLPLDAHVDLIRPCRVATILQRAAANIIIAVRWNQRRTMGSLAEMHTWSTYAAFCVFLFSMPDNNQILPHIVNAKPLDALAVLQDIACPVLEPANRTALEQLCLDVEQADEQAMHTIMKRSDSSVKYFIGLVVRHVLYDYVGCIIAWHPLCLAHEDMTAIIEKDRLGQGWDQPFYWLILVDGSKKYVAEEDLSPICPTKGIVREMLKSRSVFGQYFEGVQVSDAASQRGRLLLTQELQTLYPEDNYAGSLWVGQNSCCMSRPHPET
ncbi:hypothetical protein AcW2_000568 [Taiwanofungus camphoratus]|nr:hypothetical protein AcW2_000568 [Antrodia cinnamomea]